MKTPTPEEIVQQQVKAYNAHDVAAFMATFSPDVELFELPGGVRTMQGREALRAHYARRFGNNPQLRAEVSQKMFLGDFVIYHETLFGLAPDVTAAIPLVAIYQIDAGLIRRVWFVRS